MITYKESCFYGCGIKCCGHPKTLKEFKAEIALEMTPTPTRENNKALRAIQNAYWKANY